MVIRNCFACELFRRRYEQQKNPICYKNTSYCGRTSQIIDEEYKYEVHECCIPSFKVIQQHDEEIRNISGIEEKLKKYQEKYELG